MFDTQKLGSGHLRNQTTDGWLAVNLEDRATANRPATQTNIKGGFRVGHHFDLPDKRRSRP